MEPVKYQAPIELSKNLGELNQAEQGVEAVAWVQPEALFYITAGVEGGYRLAAGMCSEYTEPLYSEATVSALQKREAGLRAAIEYFCAHFIMAHDDSSDSSDLRSESFRQAVRDLAAAKVALGDQT